MHMGPLGGLLYVSHRLVTLMLLEAWRETSAHNIMACIILWGTLIITEKYSKALIIIEKYPNARDIQHA